MSDMLVEDELFERMLDLYSSPRGFVEAAMVDNVSGDASGG
jgi:hypothetical protein